LERLAVVAANGKLVEGHQLDRRHAERLEIRNLLDHSQIAAGIFDAARLDAREAADVHLVDHSLRDAAAQMAVALPIEKVVDHDAFGWADDAVGVRLKIAGKGFGVRIDQPCAPIEALPAGWIEWPVGLEMVKLTLADVGNEQAPDIAPTVVVPVKFE